MNPLYTDHNKKMFFFLVILAAAAALGLQGWRTVLNNFAVEVVGITGEQNGAIQGLREVPGFLSFLVIYVLLIIKEHKLAALSVLILGLGIMITGVLASFSGLLISTLIMSFGFHYYETVNQSMTLQHFSQVQVPLVLGRMRAVGSVTNIATGGIIFGLAFFLDYADMFWLIGGLVAVVGVGAFFANPTPKDVVPQKKKMILKKRYWLFYALTFMAGARRQIFMAFAVFLLVQRFEFTIQEITGLFILNNFINFFVAPMVGKAINHFGERKVLSAEYSVLIFVFLIYAITDSKLVVAIVYIVDHIFFNGSMAIASFFRKIADPAEVAPSMAVGFTINHIVAVIIPVLGGMAWMVDYRIPFVAGSFFALISLILAQIITREIRLKA